uniref:Uncharacterized protein AlNc14C611G12241 n=1 Tax=Albugo laibachii Nc14 TaxID=890382 RepID=F0X1F0_9STRA|nr:hypothetical protein ALNC14_137720 [Albugo laibachii Nc14]|eukprot:CCA27628.1 hypothetical protein ALNC14_137720 [Albugo laibachii Nc14]
MTYYDQVCSGITFLWVYVDDRLVKASSVSRIESTFNSLSSLSSKNLGPVSKFLGMRVHYSEEDGYSLDQEHSICELISKMGLDQAHPVLTPIGQDYSDSTTSSSEELAMPSFKQPTIKKFQSLAGSLLWSARCTRPDIGYAVHKLTRRTHAPTTADWVLGISLWKRFQMLIMQRTMKRGRAYQTMKAEFVAAAKATQELLGARELFRELKIEVKEPMILWMDNEAAISKFLNEAASIKAKHMDVRLKYVR